MEFYETFPLERLNLILELKINAVDELLPLNDIEPSELGQAAEALNKLIEIIPGDLIDPCALLSPHPVDQGVNHDLLIQILIISVHCDHQLFLVLVFDRIYIEVVLVDILLLIILVLFLEVLYNDPELALFLVNLWVLSLALAREVFKKLLVELLPLPVLQLLELFNHPLILLFFHLPVFAYLYAKGVFNFLLSILLRRPKFIALLQNFLPMVFIVLFEVVYLVLKIQLDIMGVLLRIETCLSLRLDEIWLHLN